MSNNTQPEIRFPGFTEDWEERKLRDITERVRGNDGRMDLPTLTISASSGWLDQRDRFSGNIAGKEQKNYTLLKKGQLSYNHGNSKLAKYGVVCELTTYDEALVPRVYHSFDTNELASSNFIEYMFATKRPDRELAKLVSSGARMDGLLNINFDEFMGINVSVPSVEEQQKIGTFFKQIDDTIALHQSKLDLLKETKKGFLQKMFPKNGAKVPEVRFPGFTEDWEQRKLGDVTAEVFQGINTAGDKVEYSDTGTPILQAKHITGGDVTFDEARFLDKERYSNYFPKYVPVENDILFANIGTIGPSTVVRDESEFLVAWNILKITLKKPEIAEFIQLQLDQLNQKHYFDSVLTGNATKFVNKDEMLRTPISVPTIEEQKKVGAFFSNIQRAITLHQRKLDLLKETKKGFLQKMFV
ncbi:restriction endonuclease subunit S [Enterococcus durans]|uniref:Type IC HsdS subunit n=1 Tax=Enterococcus durans TaxID=53345 RepID=A0A377KLZ6_9ENTE|nr:restriction endonuclease subunit S [Enterococcus durans]STP29421.1 type IC HsdS subunit [Enterococcus durans]